MDSLSRPVLRRVGGAKRNAPAAAPTLRVIPAQAGIQSTHETYWIPAYAGMTVELAP